jgi:SAM-dependent methyltransferase
MTRYDTIGRGYADHRRPDPRIEAQILRALGDAKTVVNVGAGSGSYEPMDRPVVAVEPSTVMIDQRPPGSAPVVRAAAETLPFGDGAFDAAMAILTVHHWSDPTVGLRELPRVSRRQVVFTFLVDSTFAVHDWLSRDYFPAFGSFLFDPKADSAGMLDVLGEAVVEPILVPHDCVDGFGGAYWRRPEAYLDPGVRRSISAFAMIGDDDLHAGLDRLAADLESGEWHRRNAELLELDVVDLGYRLVIAGDD